MSECLPDSSIKQKFMDMCAEFFKQNKIPPKDAYIMVLGLSAFLFSHAVVDLSIRNVNSILEGFIKKQKK